MPETALPFIPFALPDIGDDEIAEVVDPARDEEEVIEEVQKGYTLHGRLVRPSKVKISKKS